MPQTCQCATPTKLSDNVTGEILCAKCGTILESNTTGYTAGNEKNTAARHDYGIGTEPPKLRLAHNASQKIAQHETDEMRKTKNLFLVMRPILQQVSATDAISEEAYGIARVCVKNSTVAGRGNVNVATACVMVACKIHGKSIPESEIISIANARKKITRRAYRRILETQNVKTPDIHTRTIKMINRICSACGMSQKTAAKSVELLERIREKDSMITASSHPGAVAGYVVYMSCNWEATQNEIAQYAGVSAVSLRNFARKIDRKDLSVIEKVA